MFGDVDGRPRLLHLGRVGACGCTDLIALADRNRTPFGQLVDTFFIRQAPFQLRFGGGQFGAAGGQRRPVGGQGLRQVLKLEAARCKLGPALFNQLAILTIIDAHQWLALLDLFEVLHQHLGHIAADLWRQHGDLSAHIGILGDRHAAGERPQLPGIKDRQDADKRYQHHQDHRSAARFDGFRRIVRGRSRVGGRRRRLRGLGRLQALLFLGLGAFAHGEAEFLFCCAMRRVR